MARDGASPPSQREPRCAHVDSARTRCPCAASKRAEPSRQRVARCRRAGNCSATPSRPAEPTATHARSARCVEAGAGTANGSDHRPKAGRMKQTKQERLSGAAHVVPLCRQAVAILREFHPLTGHGRHLFPSPPPGERPMSDNGVLSALPAPGLPERRNDRPRIWCHGAHIAA